MANITTVPYNFDELYNALKAKFNEKGYDTAEGSNTSQLVTAMAYLTSMLNVNTSININENILSLAAKRNNVLQDARILGYEAGKEKSYVYQLELKFDADGSYTIPQYTEFTSGTKSYYYTRSDVTVFDNRKSSKNTPVWVAGTYTLNDVVLYNSKYYSVTATSTTQIPTNSDWTDVTTQYITYINVKEGKINKYSDNATVLSKTIGSFVDSNGITQIDNYIDIPFQNVEDDGLEVFLTYIDNYGYSHTNELWTKSISLGVDKDDSLDKKYFRVDNIDYETPRVYFSINGIGNTLRIGTQVNVNTLTTSAIDGAITTPVKTTLTNVNVSNYTLISKGTAAESIDSIKNNAPLLFNTAGRSITKSDYKVISERTTLVGKSEIWGGEEEIPNTLGQLYFSFVPEVIPRVFSASTNNLSYNLSSVTTGNYFLTDESIRSTNVDPVTGFITNPGIFDTIDKFRPPSLSLNVRNPIYTDITTDVKIIKYTTTISKETTRDNVFNVINDYFLNTLENFYSEIFISNIIKRIDTNITDISGVELSLKYKLNLTSNHLINLDNVSDDINIYLNMPYEEAFNNLGKVIIEDVVPDSLSLSPADFDSNGQLIISKQVPKYLPNIETNDFIETGKHLEFDIDNTTYSIDNTIVTIPIVINEPNGTAIPAVTQVDTIHIPDNTLYRTTGGGQIVTLAVGDTILFDVASGTTGTGVHGKIYRALNVKTSIDIDTELFLDAVQWADDGYKIPPGATYNYSTTGSSSIVSIIANDIVYIDVGSSSSGRGSVGNLYKANSNIGSADLNTVDFDNTINWTDLGVKSQNAVYEVRLDGFSFKHTIPDNTLEDEYNVINNLRDLINAEQDVRALAASSASGSTYIGNAIPVAYVDAHAAYLILSSKITGWQFSAITTLSTFVTVHQANDPGHKLRYTVGNYVVHNGIKKYIKISLFCLNSTVYDSLQYTLQVALDNKYKETTLKTSDFNSEKLINLVSKSGNIKFYRNNLPRLRNVNIV